MYMYVVQSQLFTVVTNGPQSGNPLLTIPIGRYMYIKHVHILIGNLCSEWGYKWTPIRKPFVYYPHWEIHTRILIGNLCSEWGYKWTQSGNPLLTIPIGRYIHVSWLGTFALNEDINGPNQETLCLLSPLGDTYTYPDWEPLLWMRI